MRISCPSSMTPPAAPRRDPADSDVNAERIVLARAEDALNAHQVKQALAAIEEHARRWHGRGVLAAKREALRAQAEGMNQQ